MVTAKFQSEIFLELVFAASSETVEQKILEKSIPLYMRKLNCFLASVIKITPEGMQEVMLVPHVAARSQEWIEVKKQFTELNVIDFEGIKTSTTHGKYFYAFGLSGYGILVLGRKKPFSDFFINELRPVVNSLSKVLMQAVIIEQRQQAELQLKESEKRLRTLADTTSAGIFIYSNHRILYANRAAEILCGYSLIELMNKKMISIIHPAYRKHIREVEAASDNKLELKIVHKNGYELMLEINVNFILWDEQPAVIISAFDISDRKKLEDQLRKAKEKAEESDRLKTAFLANMSHEIRTPMNGILGFASLLKEPKLSGENMNEYIEIIEHSGARMLNIINDLIDISRIEAGQLEIQPNPTNINEKFDYLLHFFEPEILAKNLTLLSTSRLPDATPLIVTDGEKLMAIFINLIKNALKFTDTGSINFGCEVRADRLYCFVKDTGIGIPQHRQKAIFERFIQADITDSRAAQGAGLGLAISKAYVELLGGMLEVESKENTGSTFYFDIPLIFAPPKNNAGEKPALSQTRIDAHSLKVIIVEDDPTSQLLLKKICKKTGCTILVAGTGQQAINLCRENMDTDLILMDIKLPGMDGYEATKIIRGFNPKVFIIAQTAFGFTTDREKALEAGCDDYIAKPLQEAVLIEKINYLIHQRLAAKTS